MERTRTLRDAVNYPDNPNPPSFAAGDVILSSDAWVWAFKLCEYPNICAFCFAEKEPKELRMCSVCKLHRYCSAECQKKDWKREHKLECSLLKAVSLFIPSSVPVHVCDWQFCGHFAYSVYDLLMAKLAYKIKNRVEEDVPGTGKARPLDLLRFMPENPPSDVLENFLDLPDEECPPVHKLSSQLAATEVGVSMATWTEIYRIVHLLSAPINQGPLGVSRVVGKILYQHAVHPLMRGVCSDVNAIVVKSGRRATVYAAENISCYTGLSNLRYKLWDVRDEYTWTRTTRRVAFEKLFRFFCACRKCSKEYEAETNPLQCITAGCAERIPSDERALQGCPQCGAINFARLEHLQRFMLKYEGIGNIKYEESVVDAWSKTDALLKELDAAGLVHGDAHIRYILGWELVPLYITQGQYEATWTLMQNMVSCIRTIYPTFHDTRAVLLNLAAMCPLVCLRTILCSKETVLSKSEKVRLKSVFIDACTIALPYVQEARQIFVKLTGEDSDATKQSDKFIVDLQRAAGGSLKEVTLEFYRYNVWFQAGSAT